MAINQIYAGIDQPSCASLTTGGRSFYCEVWHTSRETIEGKVYVHGEDGQLVLVHAAVIATVVDDLVDCPRILAVGSLFVVHWIDSDKPAETVLSSSLYRSLFDCTDLATGWTSQGAVALHTTNQYDHCTIDEGTDEFIVARRTSAGRITVARYVSPFSWVDTAWSVISPGITIADTVLAVAADESNFDSVLYVYQDTLTIKAIRINATDGLGSAAGGEVFADVDNGDMECMAVSIVRTDGSDRFFVIAELAPDVEQTAGGYRAYSRLVAGRAVLGSTAVAQEYSQWVKNVHLESKAWTYSTATTLVLDAYCAVSHKSSADGQEFDQQQHYVIRWPLAEIAAASTFGTVYPVPVSALMDGSFDCRPHAYTPAATPLNVDIGKRLNHLSDIAVAPQYTLGPYLKTVWYACTRWQRLVAAEGGDAATELQPAGAAAGWVRFHHEDPWVIRRDSKEPTEPDTPAWRGNNSRPMALPVQTSAGLVFTGGVTNLYDGEQPTEIGFLWTPEIVLASPVAMGGSMDVEEDYYWVVIAEWPDARGTIHRSPPSRPVQATVVVNGYATLTVRCINLGLKDDRTRYPNASAVTLKVFRTYTVSGSIVAGGNSQIPTYLFRSEFGGSVTGFRLQDTPNNDRDAFAVTFDVGRSNSEVQYNELCPYQLDQTTLQWTPPPPTPHQPLSVATVWQNRLFGADPLTPEIVYSEEILPLGPTYIAPEFLDTNRVRVDGIGEVTGLVPMDQALVVFTRSSIYRLSGQPAAGGVGASLQLETVASGIGCIEPRSIVLTSEGVFFQSLKGMHRLGRGLGVDNPGANVEQLLEAAGNVRGACMLEDRHEVSFALQAEPDTGPLAVKPRVLTFNWKTAQWSLAELPMVAQASTASRLNELQHMVTWRGRQGQDLRVLLFQGGASVERSSSDTAYSDVNSAGTAVAIPLDVTTQWIHLAGITGLKRVWEIGVQMVRTHAGQMTIELWYDIDGSYDDATAADQTFTQASPADGYIRIRPHVQKFTALKVRIYESGTVAQTENARFVVLQIHYASKATARRVRLQAGA